MTAAETHAYNLRTAARVIRSRLGLPDDPGTWTFEQRQRFNTDLAAYILQYPGSFAENVTEIARRRAGASPALTLLDTSLDFGEFLSAAGESIRAVNPLDPQNVGTVAKWALFAGVAVLVAWLFINRPPRGPSPARA